MNTHPRHVTGRAAGEPRADLTEHRVVHRAIRVDLRRLAAVASAVATDRSAEVDDRRQAFRDYLTALAATIESHLRIDNGCLAAVLADAEGGPVAPPAPGAPRLVRLLSAAGTLVDENRWEGAHPADRPVATLLGETADAADALVDHQERVVFPRIVRHVRVVDHRWVQDQFRADLPPGLLAFVVPWTISHARPSELAALRAPTLEVAHRIFAHRYEALWARVFGKFT